MEIFGFSEGQESNNLPFSAVLNLKIPCSPVRVRTDKPKNNYSSGWIMAQSIVLCSGFTPRRLYSISIQLIFPPIELFLNI